jgi:hypothetical protein
MSGVNCVYTISGSPTDTSGTLDLSQAGVAIFWSTNLTQTQYGSSTSSSGSDLNPQTNQINQSTNVLMLDGYNSASGDQTATCTSFTGILNFQLSNPIFTDDETDVIYLYVVFPYSKSSYNSGVTFDIVCSLSNLGSMVSSPVYTVTSVQGTASAEGPYIVIPINKWFAFRAPGSIYQIRIEGFNNNA